VLNANISKDILDDVKQFLSSSQWYIDRGIPYRRGYLLYGPPGTGKSSFIQSLAGELDYNICIMNLSDQGMTDDRFAHLLNNLPPKCIILLEDIDAAFVDRSSANSTISSTHRTNSLTLSGLLNGLDGVVAAEERIVFMTTNYIDRLDNALARPGRCDYKVYLGNVTENQAQSMFSRFYSNTDDSNSLTAAFVLKMKTLNLIDVCSPAMLQSHFIMYRNNANEAIINLEKVINS
jgi:chaperone BCS1